jgi:hypothetical protein
MINNENGMRSLWTGKYKVGNGSIDHGKQLYYKIGRGSSSIFVDILFPENIFFYDVAREKYLNSQGTRSLEICEVFNSGDDSIKNVVNSAIEVANLSCSNSFIRKNKKEFTKTISGLQED